MRFLVPEGASVLELGCGNGGLLAGLSPARGVGVDFSERNIKIARSHHPDLDLHLVDLEDGEALGETISGTFDYVILSDTIGSLDDCQAALEGLHQFCHDRTRLIIAYYAYFWDPVLKLAELLRHEDAAGAAKCAEHRRHRQFHEARRLRADQSRVASAAAAQALGPRPTWSTVISPPCPAFAALRFATTWSAAPCAGSARCRHRRA